MVTLSNDMQSDSGGSNMDDYEVIDTDGESRDDNTTESVASNDFSRPDDIASLADTEKSEASSDDNDESENPENHAFHSFDDFATTPTIGHSSADFERSLSPPIEFEEPVSLDAENVSVKHTIVEFCEGMSEAIAETLELQNPPRHLFATIRQTMSNQSLSMDAPLRILYVGSHAAKQEIIRKIGSSVTASADNQFQVKSARNASQLYNVVPVSDFGSEKTPEIELMQSSGYQLNVEDCVSATNMKFEDQPGKPDVIKLTMEGGFSYHSVPEASDFTVEPAWDFPHVAIIYCSGTDDLDARKTRTLAKTFMSRHKIPSLVISHKPVFDKSLGCMTLDQHALHMCLDSRDPNSTRTLIHRRLPIDLASFLNVDGRQMNRNLAYLTGRHETVGPQCLPKAKKPAEVSTNRSHSHLKGIIPSGVADLWDMAAVGISKLRLTTLVSPPNFRLLLLATLLVFAGELFKSYVKPVQPSLSINGSLGSTTAIPMSMTPSATIPSLTAAQAAKAAPLTRTTAATVNVAKSKSSISNGLMSHIDLSKLSETFQTLASPVRQDQSCTVEAFDGNKILMRIPNGIKMSWLAKGDMSVNITRGDKAIATENAYCSAEGIVLEVAKEDAFGLFSISVVTTKKPKINEVFTLEFGSRSMGHDLMVRLTSLISLANITKDLQVFEYQWNRSTAISRSFFRKTLNETRRYGERVKNETVKTANSALLGTVKGSAVITKELGLRLADADKAIMSTLQNVENGVEDAVFRAQVRSKLFWLRLRSKPSEYEAYRTRALAAMASSRDEWKSRRAERRVVRARNRDRWMAKRQEAKRKKADAWKAGRPGR